MTLSYNEYKNSYKLITSIVVLAYIKNEAFISGNKFEIRGKNEIQVIAYLNRVIISVNEYNNYKCK